MNRPDHKKQKVVKHADQTVEGTSFEGIIPDPETLAQLEIHAPGCTKDWIELAKSEVKCRQKNEGRITWTYMWSTILGQIFAFVSSVLIFGVGCYAIYAHEATAGAAIITGSTASVIAAFYFRSKKKKDS